jgi:hypothetical protein
MANSSWVDKHPYYSNSFLNPTFLALVSQLNHPVTTTRPTNPSSLAEQALRNGGSEVKIRARAVAMRAAAVAGQYAAIAIRTSSALSVQNLILL